MCEYVCVCVWYIERVMRVERVMRGRDNERVCGILRGGGGGKS